MNDYHKTEFTTYLLTENNNKKCRQCLKPTNMIEIYTEAPLCCDECAKEFYGMLITNSK